MYETLLRYSRPTPRYTSYPTAPAFHEGFGESEYLQLLAGVERAHRPLSLYFHIPFCRHICYYCACNVVYTANRKRSVPYLNAVTREMDLVQARLAGHRDATGRLISRPVRQVHFGGGTPGFLSPDLFRVFFRNISDRFLIAPNAECSVELDPREYSDDLLDAFAECGFRRASLGVQDLDPRVQRAVNRVQSFAEIRDLVEKLRARGFRGINFDLIYGLPLQTVESFARTVDSVLELRPDRLSLFQFAYLPDLKQHQRRIDAGSLPASVERIRILDHAIERLTAAGYIYIGMDHFALPSDGLAVAQRAGRLRRNFQGYTTAFGAPAGEPSTADDECDLLAFGVSAIGDLREAYVQNTRDVQTYEAKLAADQLPVERGFVLNSEDVERRRIIMQLLCHFEQEFDAAFRARYAAEILELEGFRAEGLVEIDEYDSRAPGESSGRIRVTPAGRFVIRNICAVFDGYLQRLQARGQRFSQSV